MTHIQMFKQSLQQAYEEWLYENHSSLSSPPVPPMTMNILMEYEQEIEEELLREQQAFNVIKEYEETWL